MMKGKLDVANIATALVLVYAAVGGALVLLSAVADVEPELRLTFAQYLERMAWAVGGLAIGRGIKAAGAQR